jgi:methionyl-tRNA formyltransferase
MTQHGVLNVHPSLLPRWRGAAPIHAALLAGDTETGVTIIRLVAALDAGPMLLQQRMSVNDGDDYVTLEPKLAQLGAELLVQTLAQIDTLDPRPQDDAEATYCQRIEREDAHIDWSHSAETIWNQVRAYRAWPQAFTYWDGKLLKILRAMPVAAPRLLEPIATPPGAGLVMLDREAAARDRVPLVQTGDGVLRLDEVALEGRKPQSGAELLRGYPGLLGAHLS